MGWLLCGGCYVVIVMWWLLWGGCYVVVVMGWLLWGGCYVVIVTWWLLCGGCHVVVAMWPTFGEGGEENDGFDGCEVKDGGKQVGSNEAQ